MIVYRSFCFVKYQHLNFLVGNDRIDFEKVIAPSRQEQTTPILKDVNHQTIFLAHFCLRDMKSWWHKSMYAWDICFIYTCPVLNWRCEIENWPSTPASRKYSSLLGSDKGVYAYLSGVKHHRTRSQIIRVYIGRPRARRRWAFSPRQRDSRHDEGYLLYHHWEHCRGIDGNLS